MILNLFADVAPPPSLILVGGTVAAGVAGVLAALGLAWLGARLLLRTRRQIAPRPEDGPQGERILKG